MLKSVYRLLKMEQFLFGKDNSVLVHFYYFFMLQFVAVTNCS